jgi:hypothetical protein
MVFVTHLRDARFRVHSRPAENRPDVNFDIRFTHVFVLVFLIAQNEVK